MTEVGRDHDYDWAVVEPSSVRSLVQLAGRVRRHRKAAVNEPNIVVLEQNIRAILQSNNPSKAAYCKPGFEMDDKPAEKPRFPFHFSSHHVRNFWEVMLLKEMDGTLIRVRESCQVSRG